MASRLTVSHIHWCPSCQRDWDYRDDACAAPLEHACRWCWAALRAWEQEYAKRGLPVPRRVEARS